MKTLIVVGFLAFANTALAAPPVTLSCKSQGIVNGWDRGPTQESLELTATIGAKATLQDLMLRGAFGDNTFRTVTPTQYGENAIYVKYNSFGGDKYTLTLASKQVRMMTGEVPMESGVPYGGAKLAVNFGDEGAASRYNQRVPLTCKLLAAQERPPVIGGPTVSSPPPLTFICESLKNVEGWNGEDTNEILKLSAIVGKNAALEHLQLKGAFATDPKELVGTVKPKKYKPSDEYVTYRPFGGDAWHVYDLHLSMKLVEMLKGAPKEFRVKYEGATLEVTGEEGRGYQSIPLVCQFVAAVKKRYE